MLKTGLSILHILPILLLLTMSGCASIIGDNPEQMDQSNIEQTNIEQSRNAELKTEAAALREAVQQQEDELNQLQSGSSE